LLGLGLGHSKDEFQASGVPFENRGQRADEYLKVLNKVWYDEIVEHKGKFYSIPKSKVGPKPYQKKIPIYLAGFAPKALERIINSNANGWAAIPQLSMDGFKEGRDHIRKTAKENGRDPQTVEFPSLVFPEVTEDDLGSDRQLMNGSIEQIANDIQELSKEGVNHVNLVFDFSSHANDLQKRLLYSKQIKDKLIPSVFARRNEGS
jgi:alkanesulfonate monooxygenase SsuD/methylene tetrahydromethanopterin reductase-like flavin-dependent oxidoreductase (luciferase family)